MAVENIVIGDKITDMCFCLKQISDKTYQYEDMTVHYVRLSDKTGEIQAYISDERYEPQMQGYVSGAVTVNGVVLNGKNMVPVLKIKSLSLADESSFSPSDIFDGIDEAHIKGYIDALNSHIEKMRDEELKAFVKAALTDEVYEELARKPASLAYHGRYRGGALACAASVARMAGQAGLQYQKWNCGLYKPSFDWSQLIAASALCTYGVLGYFTEQPYKKTPSGVQRGYMSVMQSSLQKVREKQPLSDVKFDKLLNILGSSVPMKTDIKAACSEGMVLRHILMLYEELDMYDASLAEHEVEDGETYYYDPRLKRTVPIAPSGANEGGAA